MTFYWWSHWFWITLLCNFLLPCIVSVHSYPSQESTQEYNQNSNANKLVTKLYQTSTTLTWTTEIPNLTTSTSTEGILKLQSVTKDERTTPAAENPALEDLPILNNKDEEEYYYDEEGEDETKKINLEQVEADTEAQSKASHKQEDKEENFKRSAEIYNNTTVDVKSTQKLNDSSTTATIIVETNNYTNFTSTNSSSFAINLNSTNTQTTTNNTRSNKETATTTTNATTQLPQAPSTPNILKTAESRKLEWLNTVAGQLPAAHLTTDLTKDYPEDDEHKIPFTLENVNKRDELRREENEHRTRKSKGLSAEYKVNRYINYSSDSKNLLTRSAATTVNEYDSEESNISSEALSVQRAYFMDVGAISAICFTLFGICCTVGTIGIVLYRRRFLNKPQALSEPDSSVYIDDSTMRVSDNSDEMYSLDNDSFLNSLEAMTIQNYWTDTVKHTKL